ncbi:MAG: alpha/beta hydrolase family protein [Acidimicrobiales bacterium]
MTTELTLAEKIPGGVREIPTIIRRPQPPAPGGTMPLVVFSPGYDIAPETYAALLDHWATAGYLVAEPLYQGATPGPALDEADIVNDPADLRFVITSLTAPDGPLAGMVDSSEVAVAGHSDGGDVALAVAAGSCCRDPAVRAGLILSGAELSSFGGSYFSSASVPLLVVQGTADTVNPPACSVQIYDGATGPRYYLSVPAASHLGPYEGVGPAQQAVSGVTTDFLDRYLKGKVDAVSAMKNAAGIQTTLTSGPVAFPGGGCPGAPGM